MCVGVKFLSTSLQSSSHVSLCLSQWPPLVEGQWAFLLPLADVITAPLNLGERCAVLTTTSQVESFPHTFLKTESRPQVFPGPSQAQE